jgi:hypothetical protein
MASARGASTSRVRARGGCVPSWAARTGATSTSGGRRLATRPWTTPSSSRTTCSCGRCGTTTTPTRRCTQEVGDDRQLIDASFVLDLDDPDLTEEQLEASAPTGAPVRLVRGFPGSGKTTALLQAGSHSWGDKSLYLTFSKRLASESEKHFQTFAPEGTSTDVMTFGELLVELGADPDDAVLVPTVGGRGADLRDVLTVVKAQLGPWSGRTAELYAELHAHALGRALPIAFKGLPASPGGLVDPEALQADRSAAIGAPASSALAFVARHLRDKDLLDDLFPTVRAARAALDRSGEALPSRFHGVSAVLVDEVQDLTAVEAMLLLTVVARIGHMSGQMPQLIVAGDEAQTVRPTAFKWKSLADLITVVLGEGHAERSEISLKENLRSPRSVGLLIEATRAHYRLLDKDQRPGGLSYTESESETEGKVLYCHVPTVAGWTQVAALFQEQPSAQLVYPASELPADLAGGDMDIALSDQVKGLDFDLVGVVDAGSTQLELQALAAKAADDPLAGALGRTLADQFRVAVSRARENLVLLDRGEGDLSGAIHELLTEVDVDPVVSVEVDELADELAGEVDPLDRLSAQLDGVLAVLEDDPERALTKARAARDVLRLAQDADEVPEPEVLATHRLFGLACALAAVGSEKAGDLRRARRLQSEAAEAFALAGAVDAFAAVLALEEQARTRPLHSVDTSVVLDAVRVHPEVSRELGPLEPALRMALNQWMAAIGDQGLPVDEHLGASLAAAEQTAELFAHRQPELIELRQEAVARTAAAAEAAGRFDLALQCYEDQDDPSVEDLGRCLERLGQWEKAADLYEAERRGVDALRCVRQIPDIGRAITLAEQVEPGLVGRLRWAQALTERMVPAYTDEGAPLTAAESEHVAAMVAAGLARSQSSVPSEGALVDRAPEPVIAAEPTSEPVPAPAPPAASVIPGLEAPTAAEALQLALTDEDGLVRLEGLCVELDLDLEAASEICRKLGIRPIGGAQQITEDQAHRLRRRVSSMRADG